ncbi:peptidoglycan-binding protein [Nonomuraea sp. NPDC050310]|uniref:efflux RND transporter periplasmic adaptor subunit n=1 Tax=Nonomuraea sp. NPDC050310 TaxID=3154935 RepID=UPI0033E8D7A0
MRRVLTAAAAIGVIAAGGWLALGLAEPVVAPTSAGAPTVAATAEITRRDLVDREKVDGTLTYADRQRITTERAGTVTWTPDPGRIVRRGQSLIKVDREPVTLLYGTLPLYRELSWGVSDGPDITQLRRNLKALGYDVDVEDEFDYETYAAVLEWQQDRGLEETGRITAGHVVFLPGAVRVGEIKAEVGAKVRPGQEIMTVSGTTLQVHVDLDAAEQALARKGARARIELPGGETVSGRIVEVGKVAESSGGQDPRTTIDVEIALDKKPKTRLDQAPVEVELQSEKHENVLAVPVEALLATREGGFGLEVVEAGGSRVVPVELGTFAEGLVEVEGPGLTEGMKVGVPAT